LATAAELKADLVGPGVQQAPDVLHRAHAAPDGQRNEHLRCDGLDHVQDDVAAVARRGDVEKVSSSAPCSL
jgi:hypothetical protein